MERSRSTPSSPHETVQEDQSPRSAADEELLNDARAANEQLVLAALRAEELAEAAGKEEALFNALPDVVTRIDRQLRHVYVNAAAERLTGRSRSAFHGKTSDEVGMPAELLPAWNALLLDTFRSGTSAERIFPFQSPEGQWAFHARTIPERGADGSIPSVLVIGQDVTDSVLYRAARADADRLRRLQALTAAFSEAPTRRDIARVLANQAHEALQADAAIVMLLDDAAKKLELASAVGYPQEIVDRWSALPLDAVAPLSEVVRTREPLFFATHGAVLERYPELADERYGDDSSLAAIPLSLRKRSFGAVALVFRQPREFLEADRAFMLSLASHAAQAIDRARLLDAERIARSEAEAANRLKDEFLATMSHELRTPLNAVLGWATILRTKKYDRLLVERAVEAIHRNARAQTKLVEDVLDVSRIVSGNLRLDVDSVDAGSVVAAAVEMLRPAAEAKRIEVLLAIEDVCIVSADPARLQQIVWNLVSNALKFTPERGRIDVVVRRLGPRVAIEVSDTGAGISAEFLPHVFERFRQSDGSTTRRQGGLGLGLAIVRHLVELHGGTVRAESGGAGSGATFTVELFTAGSDEARSEPEMDAWPPTRSADVPLSLKGLRILVVDDDDDGRELLCTALEESGADVSSAVSAETALALTEAARPDVLICDIGMPETDGYTLLRQLRALPDSAGGRTPAIALTGFARKEDVSRALNAGFQLHVAKPVDLTSLPRAIARLAGRNVPVGP